MSRNVSLLIVAAVSFAAGMAVDQVAFSGSRSSEKTDVTETSSPQVLGMPYRLADSGSVPGTKSPPRDREHHGRAGQEGRFPTSVNNALEALERGQPVDFAEAAALVLAMPPGQPRHEAIARLSSHWGRKDPEAALAWAAELSGHGRLVAMEHALGEWAGYDPAGAAAYVADLPKSEHTLHLVRRMAHIWAEQDREGALRWSLAQSDPATRRQALSGVVQNWANAQPANAASFAASIQNPFERQQALEVAARHWAHSDTDGALAWARALPAGDRPRALNAVLHEVAMRDPSRAANLYQDLTRSLPENTATAPEYRHMANEVASIWSSSSPEDAASWAIKLPREGDVRRGAVAGVVERWLQMDSVAAGEWILNLPPGGVRDQAAAAVVHTTLQTDPEAAFAWAASVGEQEHRTDLMHHSLEHWSRTDPSAAREAFQSADLPEDARRDLGEIFGPVPAPDDFQAPPPSNPAPQPE